MYDICWTDTVSIVSLHAYACHYRLTEITVYQCSVKEHTKHSHAKSRLITLKYTVSHKKTCHFVFDYNSVVS